MRVQITPEPPPPERDAIEQAVGRLLSPASLPPQYASAWRRAGLEEAVGQAAARPRTSFGATRA